jgi:hypothetical protein
VKGGKCFFLPSAFYLLQIPKWPLAIGEWRETGWNNELGIMNKKAM